MSNLFIGIDPGITGAMVLLDEDNQLSDMLDMPTMPVKGKRQQVNAAKLAQVLRGWITDSFATAYLEQVAAMPKQGVSSMFSFGVSYGIVQGVLATLGIPVVLVTPQQWKRRAGLTGKDKDMARTLAQRLYPLAELDRKKHIGRADAILIAKYGQEIEEI
jgi:crossover junction endodeoxyribonuclease RuvC